MMQVVHGTREIKSKLITFVMTDYFENKVLVLNTGRFPVYVISLTKSGLKVINSQGTISLSADYKARHKCHSREGQAALLTKTNPFQTLRAENKAKKD